MGVLNRAGAVLAVMLAGFIMIYGPVSVFSPLDRPSLEKLDSSSDITEVRNVGQRAARRLNEATSYNQVFSGLILGACFLFGLGFLANDLWFGRNRAGG